MSRNNSSLMMDADTLEKAAQTYIDNVKKWRENDLEEEIQRVMKPWFFGLFSGCETRDAAIAYLKTEGDFFYTYDTVMKVRYANCEDIAKRLVKMAKLAKKTGEKVRVVGRDFDVIEKYIEE